MRNTECRDRSVYVTAGTEIILACVILEAGSQHTKPKDATLIPSTTIFAASTSHNAGSCCARLCFLTSTSPALST
eukprot:4770756-Amphidinium_carterae.1